MFFHQNERKNYRYMISIKRTKKFGGAEIVDMVLLFSLSLIRIWALD